MKLHQDPQWPRASDWLAAECEGEVLITVIGAPLNRSVTPGRCDLGPQAIRKVLARFSTYEFGSRGDVAKAAIRDLGDSAPTDIENAVRETEGIVCLFGGDNGATRPGVRGLGVPLERVGVLTLDAHLDLRHLDDGPMNGNPIRGLIEDGVKGENIVQIGLQSFANSSAYAEFGRDLGLCWITEEDCHRGNFEEIFDQALEELAGRVDIVAFDLDLDVMDRAFAPGCPGSRPGGLAPWQVRRAARIAGRHPKVQYLDLVELDPELDEGDRTAMAAAACFLEFVAGVQERS